MEQSGKNNIKEILIIVYLVIGLGVALYCWGFGDSSDKGFLYNFGKGLVWPAVMFPALGKAIGAVVFVLIVIAFSLS